MSGTPPTTASRRMRQCRVMPRPWNIPTLVGHPPPAPAAPSPFRPPAPRPPPAHDAAPALSDTSARVRRRKRNDCVIIPDMGLALEIHEARRAAAALAHQGVLSPVRALPTARSPLHDAISSPAAIGLLMLVAPPLAVTLVWTTPRFDDRARIALTLFGALVTALLAGIVVATLT